MAAKKQKTTSQKHAEVRALSDNSKRNIHEMLRLTTEILADEEYADHNFGGQGNLIDHFEKNEYSLWAPDPSLTSLLRAYKANPDLETWKEYKFNVWAMIDLATPSKEKGKATQVNWKKMAKELEARVAQLESLLEDYQKVREDNAQLRVENSELRGELKAYRTLGGTPA